MNWQYQYQYRELNASRVPAHIVSGLNENELSSASRVIDTALAEDIGSGDATTLATVEENSQSTATFLAKSTGIISGTLIVELVFLMIEKEGEESIKVEWAVKDGDEVEAGSLLGSVHGSTRSLLMGERVALNLFQRMSGIATSTHLMVKQIQSVSSRTRLLDTRKTVPGLRLLDKMAVRHGGGVNHRTGLFDMVMIKDNHIAAAGGIRNSIEKVKKYFEKIGKRLPIEVEVRTIDELNELLEIVSTQAIEANSAGHVVPLQILVQRIMLDNSVDVERDSASGKLSRIDTSRLREFLRLIELAEEKNGNGERLEVEVSGNVTLETVAEIARTEVTFISTGAITHSVQALDISLKIKAK